MAAEQHIHFHSEDFPIPEKIDNSTKLWIENIVSTEQFDLGELNYIFCSDKYLLKINNDYLQHDYYTDIITFDNSEAAQKIEGDIFISVERVKENAKEIGVDFQQELKRVMAHGILHLCGYGDKTEAEQKLMREKEEEYM